MIRRYSPSGKAGVVVPVTTDQQAPSRARILVVEDDRSSRSALMALLRLSGFEALPAGTVLEGMQLLEKGPNCLILDLMLPDGNGSQILAYIRQRNLPIRVAVTTGAIDWEKMLQSAGPPPDAVFPKPVDVRRLIDWLQAHCDGHPNR